LAGCSVLRWPIYVRQRRSALLSSGMSNRGWKRLHRRIDPHISEAQIMPPLLFHHTSPPSFSHAQIHIVVVQEPFIRENCLSFLQPQRSLSTSVPAANGSHSDPEEFRPFFPTPRT
jgi:hypothetical protein